MSFTQSNAFYFGGDKAAFDAVYTFGSTALVSEWVLSRYAATDSFLRRMYLSPFEGALRLALAVDIN